MDVSETDADSDRRRQRQVIKFKLAGQTLSILVRFRLAKADVNGGMKRREMGSKESESEIKLMAQKTCKNRWYLSGSSGVWD